MISTLSSEHQSLSSSSSSSEFQFVPRLQLGSGILSLLNSSLLLIVGIGFICFPVWVLSVLVDYNKHDDDTNNGDNHSIDNSAFIIITLLSRMVGCVLLGQGISCIVLLCPMLGEGVTTIVSIDSTTTTSSNTKYSYSRLAIWNVRTSVTIQLITGLLWIIVALFVDYDDDRNTTTTTTNTFGLLLIGFIILVLGCFSMMLSFFPTVHVTETTTTTTTNTNTNTNLNVNNNDTIDVDVDDDAINDMLLRRADEIQIEQSSSQDENNYNTLTEPLLLSNSSNSSSAHNEQSQSLSPPHLLHTSRGKTAVGATTAAIVGGVLTGPFFLVGAAIGGAVGGVVTDQVLGNKAVGIKESKNSPTNTNIHPTINDDAADDDDDNEQSSLLPEEEEEVIDENDELDLDDTVVVVVENGTNDDSEQRSPSPVLLPTTSRIRGTQRLLAIAKPQVVYLYIGCLTLLVRLPFSLCIPHFVSTTLTRLSEGQFESARHEIKYLFLLGTIDALLDFWCIFWFQYANHRIVRGVRMDTFLSMLKQDIGYFDSTTSGELASRLNSDCGEMAGDLTWFFRFSIESVVRISGITAYMLLRSPKLGGCAISIVPLVAIVNKYYGNWLSENATKVQDALAEANSVAQETLACIRTVVAFASEEFEYQKYKLRIDEQYRLNIRQTYVQGVYFMFVSTFLINTIVQGTLLLIGTYMIEQGNLTNEILLAFMLYQGQLQNEMMNLFNSYSSLIKSSGAGDKVFEILDRKPPPPGTGSHQVVLVQQTTTRRRLEENNDSDNDNAVAAATATTTINNNAPVAILFEKVEFAYPMRPEQPILKGIDLRIDAGSTFALVGPSGCGKSTIVNLLQRFYDVSSGRIMINGVDIKSFDLKQHRNRIGIVTQDPILMTGTILSNITYGMPNNASREEAIAAARSANAHDFICTFPNGYETEVGERGIALSGGQKQRIAIARSIIRHPSLLLLDEATSALDAESERLVQGSIDNLLMKHHSKKSITTIIVAHRLQTVRNADCIAVINDGGIIEKGSHESLMTIKNGYYKSMIDKSMGGDKIMM